MMTLMGENYRTSRLYDVVTLQKKVTRKMFSHNDIVVEERLYRCV